jgi:thiol:disulfide interchange protein
MKDLLFKKLFFIFLILFCAVSVCDAQRYKRSIRNPERELFSKSLNNKTVKVREAPSIERAKKKQAATKKKQDKEYYAYVKKSRKHAVEIQSPEVKARMLENRKESDLKYKEKRRKQNRSL